MITMKFGGTSVGDIQRIREVASIVKAFLQKKPLLIVSAMGGVTDLLLETAERARNRETAAVEASILEIRERHEAVIDALISNKEYRSSVQRDQSSRIDELTSIFHGVGLLKELSVRSLDAIAAFGEVLSAVQLSAYLNQENIAARFIDSRALIKTDAHFGEAAVNFPVTNEKLRSELLPLVAEGIVPVVTGFIGSTEDGITTTLGRSGSDYTASIVGAALGAEEIWIWTDVDGVMTADPRYVSGAKVLSEISYREAAEMSYFGARVLHPKTMTPAIERKIPIRIKNTFNPSHPGTIISDSRRGLDSGVKNVTSIDNLSIISLEGNGMVGVPGIAARIFSALARVRVNVMMISQASSEHNVCIVVPEKDCAKAVRELRTEFEFDLQRKIVDDIGVQNTVSIVAVVGEGMKGMKGIAGKTFTAVANAQVNIVAIAQGSSELNISFVVDQADVRKAVQAIHDVFHLQ